MFTDEQDLPHGYGSVELPSALARKYPNAEKEFGRQAPAETFKWIRLGPRQLG